MCLWGLARACCIADARASCTIDSVPVEAYSAAIAAEYAARACLLPSAVLPRSQERTASSASR